MRGDRRLIKALRVLDCCGAFSAVRPRRAASYGTHTSALNPTTRRGASGYRGLTVVDAVKEVLQRCAARAQAAGRAVKFELADVVAGLDYPRYSYNSIIDKARLGRASHMIPPNGSLISLTL